MKKLLPVLLCAILFTSCEVNTTTESKPENNVFETTETLSEADNNFNPENNQNYLCGENDINEKVFKSFDSFKSYMESGDMNKDFSGITYADTGEQITYDDVHPCVPAFDESKYQLDSIKLCQTNYKYIFKNLIKDGCIVLEINFHTYYHSFEEMAESANANLVTETENMQTTVWGDTPALVQSIQFSDPVEYSIQAMIDENNKVYMSCDGMTPEELTACLNDFTFE